MKYTSQRSLCEKPRVGGAALPGRLAVNLSSSSIRTPEDTVQPAPCPPGCTCHNIRFQSIYRFVASTFQNVALS